MLEHGKNANKSSLHLEPSVYNYAQIALVQLMLGDGPYLAVRTLAQEPGLAIVFHDTHL